MSDGYRSFRKRGLVAGAAMAFLSVTGIALARNVVFNIPRESLSQALRDYGRESGRQIIFSESLVKGRTAQKLAGAYRRDAALSLLLKGTGLVARFRPSGAIMIERLDVTQRDPVAPQRQREPPAVVASGSATALAEVVVTAQKRRQNLQDVPISIQVYTGQKIANRNLNSLRGLSEVVPTVFVSSGGRSDNLFVRGIGAGLNASFEQAVATFLDGIYHGRSRLSAATFLDVARVEILKGPQTTFFGNDAIAGALNIVTRKPGDHFDASARALYGSYGRYDFETAAGGPVTDKFGIRVALTVNGQSGWLHNVTTGKSEPDENNMAGRVTMVYRPVHGMDVTLKIEGSKDKTNSPLAMQMVGCPPPPPFTSKGFCAYDLANRLPVGLNSSFVTHNQGENAVLGTGDDVLTVNYRHAGLKFTSETGFTHYHDDQFLDYDDTPQALLNVAPIERYHQFSQELRVASDRPQTLQYMLGMYLQSDGLAVNQDSNYLFMTPNIARNPAFAALVPHLPLGQQVDYSQQEHVYSVFGSVTWNVTDRLKVSGGLRGSWVPKTYDYHLYYGTNLQSYGDLVPFPAALQALPSKLGLGVPASLSGSRYDHAWMPSANVKYRILPHAMAYVSYAHGFLSGGFNNGDTSGLASNLPFGPEYVNSYEAGLKSKWLNDTALLNLDVFRSNYSDLQVTTNMFSQTGGFGTFVRNAAAARSEGIEFDGEWHASSHFHFLANVTYLHSYYLSYPNVTPTQLQQFEGIKIQNLSGRPTEYAPKWSGSVSATYIAFLPGGFRLTSALSPFFSSSYFLTSNDDNTLRQGSYVRWDASLAIDAPDGHWSLDLIGKNLSNQTIAVWGSAAPTSSGSSFEEKEEPRNFAVQVRYYW